LHDEGVKPAAVLGMYLRLMRLPGGRHISKHFLQFLELVFAAPLGCQCSSDSLEALTSNQDLSGLLRSERPDASPSIGFEGYETLFLQI
jgi:hypothetical protein